MARTTATLLIGVSLVMGISLVVGGRSAPSGAGFMELHRGDVSGTDDREVVMGLIERTSESRTGKHYHPGGEFGFVLEGAITVSNEGGTATLRPGESRYQHPGEWHVVGTAEKGAKTLLFRVLDKGQPEVVAVE